MAARRISGIALFRSPELFSSFGLPRAMDPGGSSDPYFKTGDDTAPKRTKGESDESAGNKHAIRNKDTKRTRDERPERKDGPGHRRFAGHRTGDRRAPGR